MLACLLLLIAAPASAKDLNGRLGVGASAQLTGGSALSVRYGLPLGNPLVNLMVEADVGVDAGPTATALAAGGRVLYGVVAEDNMNLLVGAGAAYVTDGLDGHVRVQPSLGAEFFLFGLENLGFDAEIGLDVDVGASSRVTVRGAPGVGFHYYF